MMLNRPLCSVCLIVFLLMSLGIIIDGAEFADEFRSSVLEEEVPEEGQIQLSGQVYDKEIRENYQILYLKNNSIIYRNNSFQESKIIIYDEEKMNIAIGNKVSVSGPLSFYEEERNPGNFNQKLYYQKQGIRASVWASKVIVTDAKKDKVRNDLFELRTQWKEMLYQMLGKKDGATLAAILLGEKAGMDEDTKELYETNGIGHILAISGLHLSIIGVGLYQVLRKLSGSYFIGGGAGIGFLIIYILMIGMSISVLRALIMFLFRVGADITGRHYDSPTALSVAALITIIWKPLYLYDGGFWLSYGAILAIILVLPVFEELIFQSIWSSVSINLMTLPILLYYFYEIPLYSVIINMIVVPLMTVVLVSGMLGSICCVIPFVNGISGCLLWICSRVFDVYEILCELFMKLPFAQIIAGQPEIWQMVVYYICLLSLVVLWRYKRKWRIGSVLVLLSAILLFVPMDEKDTLVITVLDVGQGDGIFIKGPEGNTYLIDGGSSDVKKVGQYRIETFLKSQGVGKIDYVFVSHGDSDHTNGIVEMLERMDVGVAIETIVLPDRGVWDEKLIELAKVAMNQGVQVVVMEAGQELIEGEMKIRCFAPLENKDAIEYENSNSGSMILGLHYGDFDMLLTGDVEAEGEEALTKILTDKCKNVSWDVLKVAHHGSKNSSSEEFLKAVRPFYALISAGRDNIYGHPHDEALERLKNAGSEVLSTQECGAITVVTDGEKMKVEGYSNVFKYNNIQKTATNGCR